MEKETDIHQMKTLTRTTPLGDVWLANFQACSSQRESHTASVKTRKGANLLNTSTL